MRLLLAASDPIPGPLHAKRTGACAEDAAVALEHARGATAGFPAVVRSAGPARSQILEEQVGTGGGTALQAGGVDGSASSLLYMLAWYSLVAPALGLPVPLALWTG